MYGPGAEKKPTGKVKRAPGVASVEMQPSICAVSISLCECHCVHLSLTISSDLRDWGVSGNEMFV